MKTNYCIRLIRLGMMLSLLLSFSLLTACGGSPPTTFYILESNVASPAKALADAQTKKMPKVILQEVTTPSYLDRSNITTRHADGVRLDIADFHSWSEDLSDGAHRVLSDVLMTSLLKEDVMLLSLDDDASDARKIFVFIRRLDGTLQGQVTLDARWTMHTYDNRELVSGVFVESMPAGLTYTSLVQAQSALMVKLAEHISGPIGQALHRK